MALPVRFLFTDDGVNPEADANELKQLAWDLGNSEAFELLKESMHHHIEALLEHLVNTNDSGDVVRGRIQAYRDVMKWSNLVVSKCDNVIDAGNAELV